MGRIGGSPHFSLLQDRCHGLDGLPGDRISDLFFACVVSDWLETDWLEKDEFISVGRDMAIKYQGNQVEQARGSEP